MANKVLDSNGVLYLWQKIKNIFVAKEDGKGLSSNDYTTEHKNAVTDLIKNGVTAKDAVLYNAAQALTDEQKTQARANIGAVSADDKGIANGVASLDENGQVPSEQLPSYVDDVIEGYYNLTDQLFYQESEFVTAITGEAGKIYLDISTSPATSYRFGGTVFAPVASSDISPITNAEIDSILAS